MQRTSLSFAVVAACLLVSAPGFSQTATSSRTKTHVQTLASDKFEGRLTGSPGEKLAADYLISELKRMGAKPLPGMTDFRMPFTFTAGSKDGGSTFGYKNETTGAVGLCPLDYLVKVVHQFNRNLSYGISLLIKYHPTD